MHYSIYGIIIESSVAIPAFEDFGTMSQPARFTIRISDEVSYRSDLIQVFVGVWRNNDSIIYDHPEVGRAVVRKDGEVSVKCYGGLSGGLSKSFFLGPILGGMLHIVGVLSLHASSVSKNGSCICFAGPSGAGKSTTAAGMTRLGWRPLGDDIAPIFLDAPNGTVLVHPGPRRFRLDAASLRAMGHDISTFENSEDKALLQLDSEWQDDPSILKAIFILGSEELERPKFSILSQEIGANVLAAYVHRPYLYLPTEARAVIEYLSYVARLTKICWAKRRMQFDGFEPFLRSIDHVTGKFETSDESL